MDRFNSNEDQKPTYSSIAKQVIYSHDPDSSKLGQIVKAQDDAYKNGQEVVLEDLIEAMEGVAFIDRQFIEEWIKRSQERLPLYND